MKVDFATQDRDQILTSIRDAMGGRALADIVSFDLGSGELVVTISKMGTSKLTFAEAENADGLRYTLANEKIAFTHKAFKDEVTKKIVGVIERAGGKVQS